jgi:hypothetical protein
MKIDFSKKIFSTAEVELISTRLYQAEQLGYVEKRYEDNPYLLISYAGVEEKGITPKWNVKIYHYNMKNRGHSIVCVDAFVLQHLVEENFARLLTPDLDPLRIDDAGWGFPLCGVMVGVTDERTVKTATVPIGFFRNDSGKPFSGKHYLKKYTELALELLQAFGATPQTHRIEICTGYVNQPLREKLRRIGFAVRVVEIKGLLQNELENHYKKYIFESAGADIYYDPKAIRKSDIPKRYFQSLEYGLKNCPELIKTGWESLNGIERGGQKSRKKKKL